MWLNNADQHPGISTCGVGTGGAIQGSIVLPTDGVGRLFRILTINGNTSAIREGPEAVAPPRDGELRWIDGENLTDEEIGLLQERFDLHPLAIEECRQPAQRAKVDEYGNHLFIVAQAITHRQAHTRPLHFEQLDAFLSRECLITLHHGPVAPLETVWKRFTLGAVPSQRSAPFLYYLVIDAIVDDVFPIIDELSDQIETLEAEIIRSFKGNELPRLLRIRRLLTSMRRILAPERDVLAVLLRHGDPRFDEQTSVYFRDVYDHLVRAFEQIEVERDMLGNATDAYHSVLANRTNDVMKQLTIFASIFLPLTFLTGLFGENFSAMPFTSRLLFYLQFILLLGIPAGMTYWFWRKRWL